MTTACTRQLCRSAATYVVLLETLFLTACGKTDDTSAARATASVRQAVVERRAFEVRALAYGTVEPASEAARTLTVQVESEIASVYVRPGERVKRGQRLALLRPSATTGFEVGRAQRDALAAQVEWERMARLREQSLATESELQSARAAAETAAALRDSLRQRVGSAGARDWRSPADGVVDALTARPGDVLASGTVLLRVLPERSVLLRLGIEPDLAPNLRPGAALSVTALEGGAAAPGHVQSVDPRIDPLSGLVTVLASLDGAQELPSGLHVRSQIVLATHTDALGVPRSAVLYEGNKAHVFVVEHGIARVRDVQVGAQDGDAVELISGVKSGESVVAAGNDELEDGMAVRVVPAPPGTAAQ